MTGGTKQLIVESYSVSIPTPWALTPTLSKREIVIEYEPLTFKILTFDTGVFHWQKSVKSLWLFPTWVEYDLARISTK